MIESLHIAGFKLFRDLTLPKLGRMNLFVGENNTGKSCLLEAVGLYASRNPMFFKLLPCAAQSHCAHGKLVAGMKRELPSNIR
jgi:predicted ATPase